jgi:adenylyl-sulfate kinase
VNADLGFSKEDREQNIRRAAGVARILQDAGLIVLATFITPTESSRQAARSIAREGLFCEIYVKASLETCMARDPKGFYARALRGEISNYTGLSSLFEEPRHPDMVLDTDQQDVGECVNRLMDMIDNLGVLCG